MRTRTHRLSVAWRNGARCPGEGGRRRGDRGAEQDQVAGRATDVTQLVEKKIVPLFDFERMTNMAVARHWRRASSAQQSALADEFRTLLVRDAGIDGLIKALADKNRPYARHFSEAGK
jgi:hypothetical protein